MFCERLLKEQNGGSRCLGITHNASRSKCTDQKNRAQSESAGPLSCGPYSGPPPAKPLPTE